MRSSLILAAIVLSTSIGSFAQKPTDRVQSRDASGEFHLEMSRTQCFGACPAYDLTINADGSVVFNGKEWTAVKGKAKGKLNTAQLDELRVEIERSGFFSLKDSYNTAQDCPVFWTDNPTVIISIKLGDRSKTITYYLGCQEEEHVGGDSIRFFPRELYELENRVDEIAQTSRWIGHGKH